MSKGARPTTTSTTQKTTIPSWLEGAAEKNIKFARSIPGYTPYTGDGSAGLADNQQQAIDYVRGLIGGGQQIMLPGVEGATNAMNFAAPQIAGADIQGLLSPYTQSVVDASNREIDRSATLQGQKNDAMAAKAGAFGSDRHGIVDAENTRNFEDLKARTTAGLLDQGWTRAADIARANQSAALTGANVNLAGANSVIGAGTQYQNAGMSDVQGLLTTGNVAQQTDQAQKTFDYNEYLKQYQSLYQQLQARTSATNSAPHGTTSTGTQTQQTYQNPWMGAAGLGLSALGMMGGMPGLGGITGLLGGGAAAPSVFMGAAGTNPWMSGAAWGAI